MVWFEIKLLPNAEIEVGNFYSIFSSLEEDMRFYILPGPRFIVEASDHIKNQIAGAFDVEIISADEPDLSQYKTAAETHLQYHPAIPITEAKLQHNPIDAIVNAVGNCAVEFYIKPYKGPMIQQFVYKYEDKEKGKHYKYSKHESNLFIVALNVYGNTKDEIKTVIGSMPAFGLNRIRIYEYKKPQNVSKKPPRGFVENIMSWLWVLTLPPIALAFYFYRWYALPLFVFTALAMYLARPRHPLILSSKELSLFVGLPSTFAHMQIQTGALMTTRIGLVKEPEIVLGTDNNNNKWGIFRADKVHSAVFGFPGTGKTTFLFSQIIQNIENGEGVLVLDPHGDLAQKVLTYCKEPPIYIDPMTSLKYGKVVKINFLEQKEGMSRDMVAREFMNALSKIYARFWGPRLDLILLNALYVLLEQPKPTLGDLYNILADDELREQYLQNVTDEKVLLFWRSEFKKMQKDASSAVLTKIYRIIQEKIIVPMFESYESTVDFRKIMDTRKVVIVNLAEGLITPDVANFLGSLIIAQLYLAGMSRANVPEEERVPFHIYIDEAHRFVTSSIKEMLESLRKYRVYVTLASQYLQQYQIDIAKSIPSLADTIVSFRVGKETAETLEEFFQPYYTYDQIMQLPNYYFAVSTKVKGKKEFAVLKVINYPDGPYDKEEVIKKSLDLYALPVLNKPIITTSVEAGLPYPPITPGGWLVLSLFIEKPEWTWDEIVLRLNGALTNFGIREGINENIQARRLVSINNKIQLAPNGRKLILPLMGGARAGQDRHVTMMMLYYYSYLKMGYFVFMDSGQNIESPLPDLLVYPYMKTEEGKVDAVGWDTAHRFAVEVETQPEHHLDRVIHNYKKNAKFNMPVIFVVDNEKSAQAIREALKDAHIVDHASKPGDVQIDIVTEDMLKAWAGIEKTFSTLEQQANENATPQQAPLQQPVEQTNAEQQPVAQQTAIQPKQKTPEPFSAPTSRQEKSIKEYLAEGYVPVIERRGNKEFLLFRRGSEEVFIGVLTKERRKELGLG